MLTTCGPTCPTIADGSSGSIGASGIRSSGGADGDAAAGTVARPRPSPTTARTLVHHDHQTGRWGRLLIPCLLPGGGIRIRPTLAPGGTDCVYHRSAGS